MNTPNPLVPQGSLLEQQKSKGKSNLFIAVFTILAIHVVLFAGLLMQGCKRDKTGQTPQDNSLATSLSNAPMDTNFVAATNLPVLSTNYYTETPSNPPVTPAIAPAATIPEATLAPAETAAPAVGGKEYTVVKGDSFYKIAKAHGVSITALAKANANADARKLKVGQKLVVPAAETPSSQTTTGTEPAAKESKAGSAYTVKAGDTLAKIARTHGTTIKAIRSANALKTDRLHVGQKLKMPAVKSAAPAVVGTNTTARI